jgi:hypothetical protein
MDKQRAGREVPAYDEVPISLGGPGMLRNVLMKKRWELAEIGRNGDPILAQTIARTIS